MKIDIDEKRLKELLPDADGFLEVVVDKTLDLVGGEINNDTMGLLSPDQITLLAYDILRREVLTGGFVQLIYNGYGRFIFRNPFAKAIRIWGLEDLASTVNKAKKRYDTYWHEIERECEDDEFMSLYERFPCFDKFDDEFVEKEEEWTSAVANYVHEHIEDFAVFSKE